MNNDPLKPVPQAPIVPVQPPVAVQHPIIKQLQAQQGAKLFQDAKTTFPYLADKNIGFVYSPNANNKNMLEFYSPDETERPKEIPLGQPGVQVFNPNTRPMDILADYVSHYGVTQDQKLKEIYEKFASSVPEKTLKDRYEWHQKHEGEKRSFEDWKKMTGLPELFRGYTFKQWGDDVTAKRMYTPEQLKVLDEARKYLNIK